MTSTAWCSYSIEVLPVIGVVRLWVVPHGRASVSVCCTQNEISLRFNQTSRKLGAAIQQLEAEDPRISLYLGPKFPLVPEVAAEPVINGAAVGLRLPFRRSIDSMRRRAECVDEEARQLALVDALSESSGMLHCQSCGTQLTATAVEKLRPRVLPMPSAGWEELAPILGCNNDLPDRLTILTAKRQKWLVGLCEVVVHLDDFLAGATKRFKDTTKPCCYPATGCGRAHACASADVDAAPFSVAETEWIACAKCGQQLGVVSNARIDDTSNLADRPVRLWQHRVSTEPDSRSSTNALKNCGPEQAGFLAVSGRIQSQKCRRLLMMPSDGGEKVLLLWVVNDAVFAGWGQARNKSRASDPNVVTNDAIQLLCPAIKTLYHCCDEKHDMAAAWSRDSTVDYIEQPQDIIKVVAAQLEQSTSAQPPEQRIMNGMAVGYLLDTAFPILN